MSGNLTYKQSGVDTIEAQSFVSDISAHVKRTQKNRQLCNAFGLFAAAYDLSSYKEPVIVTGTDGVGTKTEILFDMDMLETAGKDLVAMNVNDLLTTGGDPLMFLDYLGISNLETERPASPASWPACATTSKAATAFSPVAKLPKCPALCPRVSWKWPASASAVWRRAK